MSVNRLVVGEILLGGSMFVAGTAAYLEHTEPPHVAEATALQQHIDACAEELPQSLPKADKYQPFIPIPCAKWFEKDFQTDKSVARGEYRLLTQGAFRALLANDTPPQDTESEIRYYGDAAGAGFLLGGLAVGAVHVGSKLRPRRQRSAMSVDVSRQKEQPKYTDIKDLRPNPQPGESPYKAAVKLPNQQPKKSPKPVVRLTPEEQASWVDFVNNYSRPERK